MKSRIKNTKAGKPVTVKETPARKLKVELRVSEAQWNAFNQVAGNMSLTPDQVASAMIQTNIEGNEGNDFNEIAYHVLWAIDDLYPELREKFRPWLDAEVERTESDSAAFHARLKVEAL